MAQSMSTLIGESSWVSIGMPAIVGQRGLLWVNTGPHRSTPVAASCHGSMSHHGLAQEYGSPRCNAGLFGSMWVDMCRRRSGWGQRGSMQAD
ncbi:hypothetical protein HPP92_016810 [Vanilla planifolia]|uniref:Uncharacterized protein n=1 Tax=Vanilla planifolia TaxID=51239 RepID=A0A835URM1_VANPL|nr:hypothetical protein HPP92_016810 [Vanilla planifolia]